MNRFFLISAISLFTSLALFTTTSCKKSSDNGGNGNNTKDLIVVPIDRSDTTSLPNPVVALPVSWDFTSQLVTLDTFATKVDEYITPYGFAKKDIQKVNLTKLNMVIENAPGQTFNFIKDSVVSIKIYVDSFGGTNPKMVAFKDNVARGLTSMELNVVSDDIKDYFRADYMKIMVGFRTQENEGMLAGTKFRVNYTFTVSANKP